MGNNCIQCSKETFYFYLFIYFFQRALVILLLGRREGAEIEDTRRKLYKIKMGRVAGDGKDSG